MTSTSTRPVEKAKYATTLETLRRIIPIEMRKHKVRGLSLALVDDQEVVWAQGFGIADAATQTPVTENTLFRVGAISKIFTALAVLRTSESGRLDLDAAIGKVVPSFSVHNRFKKTRPITLRALLSHHSGLPDSLLHGMWAGEPTDLGQRVRELRDEYLTAPPQTRYKYSHLDYSLLGRALELRTRQDFVDVMEKDVLAPLGMSRSSFRVPPDSARAKGNRSGIEKPDVLLRDAPAGALWSNAEDMARFLCFILGDGSAGGRRFLKTATLDSMFLESFPGLPLDFGHRVGFAWMLSGVEIPGASKVAWHDGAYPNYHARVLVLRGEKLGVVLLSNSEEGSKLAEKITEQAMRLLLEEKQGVPAKLEEYGKHPKPPVVKIEEATLDSYTGTYAAVGSVSPIRRKLGHLRTRILGFSFELQPISEDTFIGKKVLMGLIPIYLYSMNGQFQTVEGRQVLLVRGLTTPIALERIERREIPESWRARCGEYRMENPDFMAEVTRATLKVEDGYLVIEAALSSEFYRKKNMTLGWILQPVSDQDAFAAGLYESDGGTFHAVEENGTTRLRFSGYEFTRLP